MSCGSGDKGELVGVKGKKYFAEKPFGMALIPGGAFIMGKSDDDLVGIQDAPTKTVTVSSFYMDETEITNSEYRQFVHWVRDSIIRTKLAEEIANSEADPGEDENWRTSYSYFGQDEENDAESTENEWDPVLEANRNKKQLKWEQELIFDKLAYPSKEYSDLIEPMRVPKENTPNFIPTWNYDQVVFKYIDYNLNGFLKLQKEGGYFYEVTSDKNKAIRNLVDYLDWTEEEAEKVVRNPSPLDVVSKSGAGPYESANLKLEEYMVENFPEDFEEFIAISKIEYKKNYDISPKNFINVENLEVYPDTTVWVKDFKYSNNEKMHSVYFSHNMYNDYPVVGITWKQAKAFCNWRTMYKNSFQKTKNKDLVPKFRLPTEAEWEYAARGGLQGASYPWGGPYTKNDRGCFMANFKPMRGDYAVDQAFYTVEGDAYDANDYGLFNMSGNVAEWVDSSYEEDAYEFSSTMNPNVNNIKNPKKITRGGSWKDVKYYLQVSSRDYEYQDVPRSFIGFRTVHDYLGSDLTANAQTNSSRIKR